MKTARKVLVLALCAILLVSATIMGTMAYLTSTTKTVTNTFTVGKVGLKLDEALVNGDGKPVDENGEVVTALSSAKRVEENDYHLLPGHEYTKDPTVYVLPDSDASYVRMLVTITKYSNAVQVLDKTQNGVILLENYVDENYDNWTHIPGGYTLDEKHDTATYEFRYNTTVSTGKDETKTLEPLFTKISIPGSLKNEQILKLDGVEIKVIAQAIQADGFLDGSGNPSADVAWAAFDVQNATTAD